MYAKELFDTMKSNLRSHNLNTSRMLQTSFRFLLPDTNSTRQQLTIFEALRTAPITVTNVELGRVLDLELSSATCPPTDNGAHHYYVRSWTFTYKELAELSSHMGADEKRLTEVSAWMSDAKLYRHQTDTFTIRYAGTVVGPGRPWDRYSEDLKSRTSGVLAEFTRAVDTVAPHVAQAAQIFLVRKASVSRDDALMMLSDPEDRERMLIEFLGHDTLLNRQRGGLFTSYIPFHEDVELFKGLATDAWEWCKRDRTNCPDQVVADLTELFHDVQVYANENSDLTGTWKHPFTDALRDMFLDQATPFSFQNTTPIVFVGKDVTEDDYINANPFLSSRNSSQAGAFLGDIIQRLAHDECVANQRDIIPNSFRINRSFWVFYDLWMWLSHKDLEAAARFLQQYLHIVRPLVVVTQGIMTHNITRANFDSLNGAKLNSYTGVICEPTIQYYDPVGPSKHSPDNAFISVPMYDPGRDKYGSNSPALRRLIDLSMRYVFLILHVTLEVLITDPADTTGKPFDRFQLCQEILARMDNFTKSSSSHAAFISALKEARDQASNFLKSTFIQSTSEDVRPVLDHAGRQVIQSLGMASGAPNSDERHEQLEEVWKLNMPELHSVIPHEDDLKDDWKGIFLPLQQDQYFYLAVLAQLPPDRYLTELLETVRPGWALDDSWVNNQTAKNAAIAKVEGGLWISRQNEEQRKYKVRFPDEPVQARDLHNHQVGFVDSSGRCRVRWVKPDGSTDTTALFVRSAVPKTDFETRTLLFTGHGINIVSGTGEAFRNANTVNDLATFPLRQIIHNQELYTMWSCVRQAHGQTVPPFGAQFDTTTQAKDWGKRKGIPALGHLASSQTPKQNRPPAELDALYPLNHYLSIHFPEGGNFYHHGPDKEVTNDKRRMATAKPKPTITTEDMKRFLEMLDTPEWCKHPYRDFWKHELLSKRQPNIGLFSKNLPLLRHTTLKTLSSGARPSYWVLGGPGSAVDDIFDAENKQSCLPAIRSLKKAPKSSDNQPTAAELASEDLDDEWDFEKQSFNEAARAAALRKTKCKASTDEGTDETPAKAPKKLRKTSKAGDDAEDDEPQASVKAPKRTRKARTGDDKEDDSLQAPAKASKRSGRSKKS